MNIVKYSSEFQNLVIKFDCGNTALNNFINSSDALDKSQGITYILLSDKKDFIIGYYNINAGRVDLLEQVGELVNYKPMGGSININYLAIHSNFQHNKIGTLKNGQSFYLGDFLLHDCEERIMKLREEVGIMFITLYSTKDGYNLYHNRNSYEEFEDDMNTFLSERDINCYKLYKCIDENLIL